jgi:hypothetical protein
VRQAWPQVQRSAEEGTPMYSELTITRQRASLNGLPCQQEGPRNGERRGIDRLSPHLSSVEN